MIRQTYEIEGIVQGIGFRPTIYNLARKANIGGSVQNSSGKVLITLEGEEYSVSKFIKDLPKNLPKIAKIESIKLAKTESCRKKTPFKILESISDLKYKISIPVDLAICSACKNEILNPDERRYRYPFTTCVNCGPRYTVINSMPYDRCRTTLDKFKLCKKCRKEYTNPLDRRFHAESIACPQCGPQLSLYNKNGQIINTSDCVTEAKKILMSGSILAIRGIGGYLLALNAYNRDAIITLRKRKLRPSKPFAIMAKDIATVKKYCELSFVEEQALISPSAPIVILKLKDLQKTDLPVNLLSPDTNTLGIMLPYSPLHCLLFDNEINMLVMTSGNKHGEPICIKNEEAFSRLNGIADFFLSHNREINLRNDDSLVTIQNNNMQVWRRSRGFAPEPITLHNRFKKNILAMGAEMKNTITLAFNNEVVISPHIGDLETPEAIKSLEKAANDLPIFFRQFPELIAVEMHPDMHSTRLGKKLAQDKNIPVVSIQHHYAHACACMAEHNLEESLAVVFDGTGLGLDNTIWGAELLHVQEGSFTRLSTFKAVKLLGGDASVVNPTRQLVSRWIDAKVNLKSQDILNLIGITDLDLTLLKQQYSKNINTSLTHAAGRLFDSISVMLGLTRGPITYEGEAAIRVEKEAGNAKNRSNNSMFMFDGKEVENILVIDWAQTFRNFSCELVSQLYSDKNYLRLRQQYSLDFHTALASAVGQMTEFALSKIKVKNIVLSGGVFMNKILTELVMTQLHKRFKLKVYIHEKIPPNDGGISFGQAIAASKLY